MKISDLIKDLKGLMKDNGDVDIVFCGNLKLDGLVKENIVIEIPLICFDLSWAKDKSGKKKGIIKHNINTHDLFR